MNTLKALMITTTLACFTQVASANSSTDSSTGNSEASYDMAYAYGMKASVGYWRTHEGETVHMQVYRDETLTQCLDRCDSDSRCEGIEYHMSTSNQGYAQNTCEVHFDSFKQCLLGSNMGGKSLSTCWVKDDRPGDVQETDEEGSEPSRADFFDQFSEPAEGNTTNEPTNETSNADGFSVARQRLEAQLALEDYSPSEVQDLINEDTPAINDLRTYLTSSCLSSSDTSGSYEGGSYVGSSTESYLALHADGTYSLSSNSAVYTGGGFDATDQGSDVSAGYWNVFQGSNGNMILVMSPESGGVSLSLIPSYDEGAIGVIPFATNERETWRRTPNSSCN